MTFSCDVNDVKQNMKNNVRIIFSKKMLFHEAQTTSILYQHETFVTFTDLLIMKRLNKCTHVRVQILL